MTRTATSCDIFCSVVDNYGDIGVCWRLARQLENEYGLQVRLWVDDLRSFGKLCPDVDAGLDEQRCRGVEVRHWPADFSAVEPAGLVIEAFACRLPESYMLAMAALEQKPVWVNLEYLSAEDWVEGCHKLPSPHPTLSLNKYFFFPGFTRKTGGLLLENNLLARRDVFQGDAGEQQRYWRSLGVSERMAGELRVSMFGYENEAMEDLLRCWEQGGQPVTCLVPEGRSLPQIIQYFGGEAHRGSGFSPTNPVGLHPQGVGRGCKGLKPQQHTHKPDPHYSRGNLQVHVLPFFEQERYDELLWACDVNFVRGEDSCVRAQWAAKPFIWQIYPQHDGVHLAKLEALRARYTAGLPPEASQAVRDLWLAWNGGPDIAGAWAHFAAQRGMLTRHGKDWADRLAGNNLALNLLDFYRQVANPRIP